MSDKPFGERATDTLLMGCVWLILIGIGAAIMLGTLLIGRWIVG